MSDKTDRRRTKRNIAALPRLQTGKYNMRKVLIAVGLVGLGALVAAQPASATKKRVCQTLYLNQSTLGSSRYCNSAHNCTVSHPAVFKGLTEVCYDIDVLVPTGTAAQIGSGAGMNTTFDHNAKTHAR
jgi:hypothetical protein